MNLVRIITEKGEYQFKIESGYIGYLSGVNVEGRAKGFFADLVDKNTSPVFVVIEPFMLIDDNGDIKKIEVGAIKIPTILDLIEEESEEI